MDIIFYIGIFLFVIGAWQAFMQGTHSEVISGILLTLGMVFVFIGNWHIGLFFIFLFASWFLLMQLFRFSTYHKYFFKIAPLLIGYAVLIAFLLIQFNFQDFFWWYLILSGLFLLINHKKQHQAKNFLDLLSGDDKEKRAEAETSFNKTIKYHLLSSVVFVASFILAFSYFS
ncbi:hypothetical protein KJ836_01980 [Patescibacteria group bacterium]|nr:hypothetical protein [Patescibacteria group bacterium]